MKSSNFYRKSVKSVANIMLTKYLTLILSLLSVTFSLPVHAQKSIHGIVTDAESGETLPVAHISVVGTRSGTVTNENGEYVLELATVPAVIRASYIGYTSVNKTVSGDSPDEVNIALSPSPVMLTAIVVSAEDKAVDIMREVIRRKQEWLKTLKTYRAEAYTRVLLQTDTTIVSIAESFSEINWELGKGPREKIKGKRQTSNIKASQNFAFARLTPNFYDDDIDVAGYKVIGPTHPDALKYYDFKLTGQRMIDSTVVYDIAVNPKGKLQPTFVGSISVLDKAFAMLRVDLKPHESLLYPPPIKKVEFNYKQQFSNFGIDYWLPVDIKTVGAIKIKLPGFNFPEMGFSQFTRFTGYEVNVASYDSLMKKKEEKIAVSIGSKVSVTTSTDEKISEDSQVKEISETETAAETTPETDKKPVSDKELKESAEEKRIARQKREKAVSDSLFAAKQNEIIPFTEKEEQAYGTIDSTMTLEKAFKPGGLLGNLIKTDDEKKKKENKPKRKKYVSKFIPNLSPRARHNRVEGYSLGIAHKKTIKRHYSYELSGSYLTGTKDWAYGGRVQYKWGKNRNGTVAAEYNNGVDQRYLSESYPLYLNSIMTLSGQKDYFDYYRNEKQRISGEYRFKKMKTTISTSINNEHHTSVGKTTDDNLFDRNNTQRENPSIEKGWLRSLELSALYGDTENIPWGILGQKRARLTIEHSPGGLLSSDFTFTQIKTVVDWKFNTYLKRRLLPNTLDVRFVGGLSTGDLPVQKFGIIDGSMLAFTPFGVLKSLRNHPLEGEHYCALFWEHNLRTVPFELIGLRWLAQKGVGIILHGAAGRTWISQKRLSELELVYSPFYQDRWHSEIGLSVNAIFSYLRVDITKRLDKRGVYTGFGIVRFL